MRTMKRTAVLLLSLLLLSLGVFAASEDKSLKAFDESGAVLGELILSEDQLLSVYADQQLNGELLPIETYMEQFAGDPDNVTFESFTFKGQEKPLEGYFFAFDFAPYVGSVLNSESDMTEAAYDFVRSHPGLYYLQTYCVTMYGGGVAKLWLKSTMSGEEIETTMPEFEQAVDDALFGIKPGMTDEQKLLHLHDYIAMHNTYDYTYQGSTAYDALVKKTSVCQGYSFAFNHLASILGFETRYVYTDRSTTVGNLQNHGWSAVKLGENWYHVDITHDDPYHNTGFNDYGIVIHQHFLLSEEGIRKQKISGYDRSFTSPEGVVANDKHYEHLFDYYDDEHELDSGFIPCNGKWYFAIADGRNATLCEADDPFDHTTWHEKTSLKQSGGFYFYKFSTVARYRDGILFATNRSVCYYHPATGISETIYSLPKLTTTFILTIGVEEDTLYVVDCNLTGKYERETFDLSSYGVETPPVDLNDNSETDLFDALQLMRVLQGEETLYGGNNELADLDGNGKVDTHDLIALILELAMAEE